MPYVDVFSSSNIYPSEITYSSLSLSVNVTLSWPEETSATENLATRIIDVTPTSAGFSIVLPDARKSGTGNTILFNNRGAYTFTVKDADAVQVMTVASGELWQLYLTDNTTEAGAWQTLQYGSTVSVANASALAGTGIVAVGAMLSQSVPVETFNSNYTAGINDRAKFYNWTGAGGTLTLPDPIAVGNNWFLYLRNSGTGAIIADAPGTSTIDGGSSLNFNPGVSSIVASDGTNFYTIGFGQPAEFAFDFTSIDVAGSGDYTLTGTELNQIAYRFTGVLTGDRVVIVPATVQQYWVDNQTTGSYVLTIKTAAGTGVTTVQNQRAILYCDGANVLSAETASSISLPVSVAQGGTGATTASGARINLGATSVGNALFTAVSQNAAWSTLGVAPSGVVNGGTF